MDLPETRALLPRVEWRERAESTNSIMRELVTVEKDPLPFGTLVATSEQTAGRGRAGRGWVTPVDTALACSFLMRVPVGGNALPPSWLPLITGSAVATVLQTFFPPERGIRVGVKWPNDVHVRDEEDAIAGRPGSKLCGILCELVSRDAVIIGIGLNLLIPEHELPTDRATSLLAAGAEIGEVTSLASAEGQHLADRVIAAIASELSALIELAAGRPQAVRTRVLRQSLTLGTEVRVHLPGGEIVDGRARALADDGSLIVDLPTGGELTVSAGDVEHLR